MDKQIAATCPARFNCKQHNVLCGTGCPLFVELRYQMEMSRIPKRYRKFTIDNLGDDTVHIKSLRKYCETVLQRVQGGQGIYLYGNTGSGKTTALCAVAMTYIAESSKQALRIGKRTGQMTLFINIPEMLDGIKRGFDDIDTAGQWNDILTAARTTPLLVLDDIGSEKPTEWSRERLTQLIDTRFNNELCTLISSNLSLPELKEHIDPIGRITSRIAGMTVPINYIGPDRRQML